MQAQMRSAPPSRTPSVSGSVQHFSDDEEEILTVKVAERPVYVMDVEANFADQPEGLGEALPTRAHASHAQAKDVRGGRKQSRATRSRSEDGGTSATATY